tara:strand:- start:3613 stop:4701 length:1089 start_codon:yes stop_codon:yes gene_type:complete
MAAKKQLHEMENQVTKGAAKADPMPKAPNYVPDAGSASVEDLGGPTPTNNSPTDDSNKLKTPSKEFSQAGNPVTKGATGHIQLPGPGAMKSSGYGRGANEETAPEGEEVVSEEPTTDEVVAEVQELEIDLEDDVKALLEGEDLSAEFKEKTKTIFEAAIKSKIELVQSNLEAQYESALTEEVSNIRNELTERVDSYLEYVANEWINENALQVESGIRGELSESFMTGLKGLFEEHYVAIPEEKYDVLEAMVSKLDEMETKLNEQIDSNVALTQRLSASVSDNILDEVSNGLALSQKEKLAELAKGVEFESEEQYREKLSTLKEGYFTKPAATENPEVISEEAPVVDTTPAMDAYIQALTKFQ